MPQESMVVDVDPFPFVDVNTTSVNLSSLMPHRNLYVKNNKAKVNSLQAFGPQERQLVQEMSSLKIERSATTSQSNSAKVSGRSLSIQDNNVHADKGKNVAHLAVQPIISYKEMLRKEPLKINSESDEDNTICERCSHILAKCFSRTKKEDDYKPPKVEEPKSVPKSIENSRSEPRSTPQPRVAQSRFGSHYEQPRMARSRLGPQYEQLKMARPRPNPHYTLDSRFESIRKPRMMRPLVSETGRWVTLETPGLKPIHKQEYKYGYNPYFSRMMRTQRRRWIRQQAALHQEYGQGDHHSSRLTTDSDSMEVITRAKALKYLRGPYAGKESIAGATSKNIAIPVRNGISHKVQNTKVEKKKSPGANKEAKDNQIEAEPSQETQVENVQDSPIENAEDINSIEDVEGIEDINDIENMEDIEDMDNIENLEDVGDIEDMEDIENIEDIDTFENFEGINDIEVEETNDIGEMEGSKTLKSTKSGIQTEEPEIESKEPKNGKTLSCNAITLPREFMATTWVQREEDAQGAVPILLAEEEECRDTGIDQNGNPSRVTVGPEEPLTMEDLFKLSQNLEETETRPEIENGLDYYVEDFAECNIQPKNGQEIMGQEQISTHPIRMDDIKEEVQDPLIEVNLGTKEDSWVTFVNGHLGPEEFNKITIILKKYKDCFAWDYPELPGLSRKLMEHRLPIKEGFQPFQQAPRRMAPDITLKIKKETSSD
uniref:Uncharacterized protein n=1 Tax=Fagus sylvatica TaxID=28930 RepID=A0A2N9EX14_FAGSY